MKVTVEFGDEITEKEAYQILLDALGEFASRRGCRSLGDPEDALVGAKSYVRNRYAGALPMPFDEKVVQVTRRAAAARRATIERGGPS